VPPPLKWEATAGNAKTAAKIIMENLFIRLFLS
jgi:hypothetical protein